MESITGILTGTIPHILLQGFIYSFVVFGVFLSSRIIGFDDLTTEGSFSFGGACTAFCITANVSGWIAIPIAMAAGALSGIATGFLHTKMKMNNLISGLVVTTALFSICLKLAGANVTFATGKTIFTAVAFFDNTTGAIVIIALTGAIIFSLLRLLLNSEIGLILKALGSNPQVITNIGKSVDGFKIAGLAIANSITALAGALFVQWNGFFSITGNVGTLVIGLAGLILAEMIDEGFGVALIVGAVIYQALFAITIELELEPLWNNLIKAALIVLLLQIKNKNPLQVVR